MAIENKNLYIMKLLTSSEEFKTDVAEIRKTSSIPSNGFPNNEEAKKWNNKLLQNEAKLNEFQDRIEKITDKYRLPYSFLEAIKFYVYFDRITSVYLPSSSFAFSVNPSGRKNKAKWVELKTYARLTEKEIREAIKILREMQDYYLPPNLSRDIRVHKNIDHAIKAEKEMAKKKRKTEEDFESILKHTSAEIAEDIFGNVAKANLVRQMCRRIKKEREELFGT